MADSTGSNPSTWADCAGIPNGGFVTWTGNTAFPWSASYPDATTMKMARVPDPTPPPAPEPDPNRQPEPPPPPPPQEDDYEKPCCSHCGEPWKQERGASWSEWWTEDMKTGGKTWTCGPCGRGEWVPTESDPIAEEPVRVAQKRELCMNLIRAVRSALAHRHAPWPFCGRCQRQMSVKSARIVSETDADILMECETAKCGSLAIVSLPIEREYGKMWPVGAVIPNPDFPMHELGEAGDP